MTLLISLLICIIGLLVYALASNPKLVRIGEICFAAGLLVTLLTIGTELVRFLPTGR